MDLFSPARLTGSGRPVLAEGEIELLLSSPCDMYNENGTKVHKGGSATATTRRVLYLKPSEKIAISLDLGAFVSKIETKSPIFGSPKVELHLEGNKKVSINFSASRERDRFYKALHSALPGAKQAHAAATAPKNQPSQQQQQQQQQQGQATTGASSAAPAAPAAAGIAGILERRAAEKRDTDVALKQAFSDLDSLISNAQKAVAIAEKLQSKTASADAASLGSNSGPSAAGKEQELVDVALNLGITSPVTRSGAGAAFHDQLARELFDFFGPLLPRAGGMLSLTDAFCLVCRARGSELVSPEDLLAACRMWEKLDFPIRLHQFPNTGVLVIHSLEAGAEIVEEKVFTAVKEAGTKGAAAAEIAEKIKVSLSLVKAHLKELEFDQRRLCRDEAASAVRYYPNLYWV